MFLYVRKTLGASWTNFIFLSRPLHKKWWMVIWSSGICYKPQHPKIRRPWKPLHEVQRVPPLHNNFHLHAKGPPFTWKFLSSCKGSPLYKVDFPKNQGSPLYKGCPKSRVGSKSDYMSTHFPANNFFIFDKLTIKIDVKTKKCQKLKKIKKNQFSSRFFHFRRFLTPVKLNFVYGNLKFSKPIFLFILTIFQSFCLVSQPTRANMKWNSDLRCQITD